MKKDYNVSLIDIDQKRLIFLHGLEGSSRGYKATLLRALFPKMLTPDFYGSLSQRMDHLTDILLLSEQWTMIGSSFGGLMAALFASRYPQHVRKLILLAPALVWPHFQSVAEPIPTPTIIYHGEDDSIIPLEAIQPLAEAKFLRLKFHAVDDDHLLHNTVCQLDWLTLVK